MSMSEYLDAKISGVRQYNSKEMYTISYNQQFSGSGLSTYLNFTIRHIGINLTIIAIVYH